ncbi:MAG TPA: methyltransferase domain-containing protein [Propionibacteriaceae bacterium]
MSGATPQLFRASTEDDESVAQMIALLDAQDALPAAGRLHDWAIKTAAVRAGDQVVDLGSGTGTLSRRLAGLVGAATSPPDGPMGWVTGVEPNARLRALAASRAESNGIPNVSFIHGLAGALPFADSSVDLVWCERVLQHLNDPQAAIDDIARVLRPGGRAVLLDADQGTRIISDLEPDVASAFVRASLTAIANPYSARHIPAQIRRAGLALDPDVGSSAFIFSSEMLLRTQVLPRAAEDAVEFGDLARDVAEAVVRTVHAAAECGDAFAAITVFGFVARKLDARGR